MGSLDTAVCRVPFLIQIIGNSSLYPPVENRELHSLIRIPAWLGSRFDWASGYADTTFTGFLSSQALILPARMDTRRFLVSRPFQPIWGVKRTLDIV